MLISPFIYLKIFYFSMPYHLGNHCSYPLYYVYIMLNQNSLLYIFPIINYNVCLCEVFVLYHIRPLSENN